MEKKVAFIGAGNMGGAIVEVVCKAVDPNEIAVYVPTAEKADRLKEKTGCCVAASNIEAAQPAKYIFLCVKPQVFESVLTDLLDKLEGNGDKVIVSIAASIPLAYIEEMIARKGKAYPVIRVLPNTPVAAGEGLFLLAGGKTVGEEVYEELTAMLMPGGLVEKVDEHTMDVACPVYSCSPAFAYMFIEALSDGAVQIGLKREQAIRYAAQGVLGAAALALKSGKHPGQLKDEVCSPGGTTIVGVTTLESYGFRAAASQAIIKAYTRMKELEK